MTESLKLKRESLNLHLVVYVESEARVMSLVTIVLIEGIAEEKRL